MGPGAETHAGAGPDQVPEGAGPVLLRITPTYAFSDGLFIQGQVELVGTLDQSLRATDFGGADTDDLLLRVGKWNSWDFQVGRFEGWEVFHLGMGLDQNTFERAGAVGRRLSSFGISFYGLTDNQFRPAGRGGQHAAIHLYPLPYLRFELLGMAGTVAGTTHTRRARSGSSTSAGSS